MKTLLFAAVSLMFGVQTQARTWKMCDGDPPVTGDFVELKGNIVTIDRGDRKIATVSLSSLSPADQTLAKQYSQDAVSQLGQGKRLNLMKVAGDPEAVAKLTPGKVVGFVTKGENKIPYHVYVPTQFLAATPPPVIIAFHPGGNGMAILNGMKASAEKMGWLLVGCDKLRNNMTDDALSDSMEDEIMADIQSCLPHDPNRIYLAGLSGGAMRSFDLSNRLRVPFCGVISYGGWLGGAEFQARRHTPYMAVAMIYGDKDGAKTIGPEDAEVLKRDNIVSRQFLWAGGHAIGTPAITDEALAWLEEQWKKRP